MDSFFRNHLLYLLCTLFVTVASQLLAVADVLSNCWHVAVCSLLSLLPKARVKFPVNRPSAAYHPAVLITGTSSGIGHDTAVALASFGYTVFAGVRSWEDGARVESHFLESIRPERIRTNPWAPRSLQSQQPQVPLPEARAETASATKHDHVSDSASDTSTHGPVLLRPLRQRRSRRTRKNAQRSSNGVANGAARTQKPDVSPSNALVGAVIPVILDVASSDSVDQAYEQVAAQLRHRQIPLVAVINNAGITACAPMDISAPAFVEHCMAVNFHGPLRVTQRFMPLLRASSGRIVNVSSVMSWLIGPGFGVYCASKAALSAASRSWRYELANNDMAVSVLEPGLTRTSLWAKIEPQLELHHSRLNGIRRPRNHDASAVPSAMPGDEAVASVSPALVATSRLSDGSDESTIAAAADGAGDVSAARSDDQALYGAMIRRIKLSNELAPLFALPTRHAVSAIIHALTSRYPKSTYRVGWDSRLMHLLRWAISDEMMEWLCRAIGIVSES
ncbi:hypothetical protein H4R20_005188 [Coemansia guatemalensis]|uniref:NAD(P)-binding protein n=1 Tax=Coemansia guatemalensis TaxID=2761395 RepID=A0A9W8LSD3_9FUNG|nr:hypothetical protein H4R20_005188 [Coemansia guatemalensis]